MTLGFLHFLHFLQSKETQEALNRVAELEAEVATLKEMRSGSVLALNAAEGKCEVLELDRDRLRAALKAVEWACVDIHGDRICPACHNFMTSRHGADCLVGDALEGR